MVIMNGLVIVPFHFVPLVQQFLSHADEATIKGLGQLYNKKTPPRYDLEKEKQGRISSTSGIE